MGRPARGLVLSGGLVTWLALAGRAAAHVGGGVPPTDLAGILASWSFEPLVVEGLAMAVLAYLWAAELVDRAHPGNPWPRRRTAAFLLGLAAIAAALLSPIDTYADDLLTVHMVQHMLLMMVAPPLLVASGPVTLALRATPARVRTGYLLPLIHSRALAVATHPVVCWLVFVLALWGAHYSPIYDLALTDQLVHDLEHLVFLGAGILFWLPVFGSDPLPRRLGHGGRLLYLLVALPQMSFLAMTIMGAPQVLYPAYLSRTVLLGIGPLVDQQSAGALMWIGADMMFLAMAGLVLARWMSADEAEARRADERADRRARGRDRDAASTGVPR